MGRDMVPATAWLVLREPPSPPKYGTAPLTANRSLTGVPIAGAILSNYHSYTGLILFDAAAYLGAVFMFGAARVAGTGWSPRAIF